MAKSKLAAILVLSLSAAGFAGLAIYASQSKVNRIPDHMRKDGGGGPEVNVDAKQQKRANYIKVFMPKYVGDELRFDFVEQSIPQSEDRMVFAVNQFLRSSHILPEKARVVGINVDANGHASLSMSPEFESGVGLEDERTLIDGIRVALGQFQNVATFEMHVEGEPIRTLGHLDLSERIRTLTLDAEGRPAKPPLESDPPQEG
ncbi:MAG: GerMN domain-containing protein [Fimbriimonadaceae bacterium]